jgi:hypothetical protein
MGMFDWPRLALWLQDSDQLVEAFVCTKRTASLSERRIAT